MATDMPTAVDVPMEAPHEAEERNMSRLGCVNVVQCVTMETCMQFSNEWHIQDGGL